MILVFKKESYDKIRWTTGMNNKWNKFEERMKRKVGKKRFV